MTTIIFAGVNDDVALLKLLSLDPPFQKFKGIFLILLSSIYERMLCKPTDALFGPGVNPLEGSPK
jgi:hypothetical protein